MYGMYQGFHGGPEWFGLGLMSAVTIMPLLVWTLAWKGWALWLAARRGELLWFVALLLLNTVGLLEIFYIFFIAKRSDKQEKESKKDKEKKDDK